MHFQIKMLNLLEKFIAVKFGLSEKHTKFEKIFLILWTVTKYHATFIP